jgi:hypothetical protein
MIEIPGYPRLSYWTDDSGDTVEITFSLSVASIRSMGMRSGSNKIHHQIPRRVALPTGIAYVDELELRADTLTCVRRNVVLYGPLFPDISAQTALGFPPYLTLDWFEEAT